MVHKVQNYIEEHHMFHQNDRVIAGVSGGADSMCLLSVLLALAPAYGLSVFAVHVNHGIRGKEADEEEAYVAEYCKKNNVICKIYHIDVRKLAKEQSWSEEEAGRNARYQAFYEAAEEFSCNKIAVAHHQKDSAETLLFHLFRGSGIKGMCGILPVRGQIIRPLLFAEKEEIIQYLTDRNVRWFMDSTNLTEDYTRNKIRNRILSYAEKEINTKAVAHIAAFAMQMQECYEFIEQEAEKGFQMSINEQEGTFFIKEHEFFTLSGVIQKEILFILFDKLSHSKRKNITSVHIADILALFSRQSGRWISLPDGIVARREYGGVLFLKFGNPKQYDASKEYVPEAAEVSVPGEYQLKNGQILRLSFIDYKKNMIIPKNKYTKWFDYDKIVDVVKLRLRRASDYIIIHKDGRRKLLKSVFIDLKVPREDRECMLLTEGSHVLWIPGVRSSEGCLIDDTTRKVLAAELVD